MRNRGPGANQTRGGVGGLAIWTFFSFIYFLTTPDVLPLGNGEYAWRSFAGPINFLFS